MRRRPPTRVEPRHAWDVLLCLALTGVALVGWGTTFAGSGWWLAGATAAVVGCATATLVVAARGGVEVVTLVLAFGYYLACGPVVEGSLRLADLTVLESGVRASAQAWPVLLGTHPPVDPSGAVLLAPVLLALLSGGLGTALALRSTRAALPLAPPTLVLALVLLLAQPEPVSVVLQGVAYGVLAMLWMRLRGLRLDEAAHGRDPARAWRMAGSVGLVLATALVAAAVTGSGPPTGDRVVLTRSLPAYDAARERTPLDDFRDFTAPAPGRATPEGNVHDRRLFTVRGLPAGARVRLAALGGYNGQRWTAAADLDPTREDDRYLRLSSRIDNPVAGGSGGGSGSGSGEPRRVRVSVDPTGDHASPWVPTIGAVQAFGFYGGAREDAQAHLRYDPAAETAVMDDQLEKTDTYAFTTVLTGGLVKRRMVASPWLDEDLYDAAAFLDPAVRSWSAGALTPVDAVLKVAERLRRAGRYSDGAIFWQSDVQPGQSVARLGEGFVLGEPTVGNDEQYAAAMALMATRLRVPARVVVGAVLPRSGVVRGRDVSAWVELRIADGSWRTLPTEAFMGDRPPPREGVDEVLPPRAFPDPPPAPPAQPEVEEADAPPPPTASEAGSETQSGGLGVPWWLVLLVLCLGGLAVVPVLKAVRRHRRRTARRPSTRVAGAWDDLVDHARDLGAPVPTALTRPAQARAVSAWLASVSGPGGGGGGGRGGGGEVGPAREPAAREAARVGAGARLDRVESARTGPESGPSRRRLRQPAPTRQADAGLLGSAGLLGQELELAGLAREADRLVYAAAEPSAADAASYWRDVRARRRTLAADLAPWRRLRAPLHPAGLGWSAPGDREL